MDKRPRNWVDSRLQSYFNWMGRFSDMGGMYMGLDMFGDRSHTTPGHISLIPECPRHVTITGMALHRIERKYLDVLVQRYYFVREENGRERTDGFRARILRISSATEYRRMVEKARRHVGRQIDIIEGTKKAA